MSTTTIFITRHGQTEWNVEHRMQGHKDSALTPLGIQQAEWLSRGLANEHLDVIYASSSPRAQRTAEIVRADRNIPLLTCNDFKEIGMGVWEGRDSEYLEAYYPDQYCYFWEDPEKFKVDGSETFAEVQARALNKLQDILAQHAGETIFIVTHTVVIKLLMAHFEGRALHKLWDLPYINPTCLCRIDFTDGVAEILLHGDTSHYEESEVRMES